MAFILSGETTISEYASIHSINLFMIHKSAF